MSCMTCKYWKEKDNDRGQCRRHAPITVRGLFSEYRLLFDEKTALFATWPYTHASSDCGDYHVSMDANDRVLKQIAKQKGNQNG